MCGIFGYVGDQNQTKICLDGLKLLEYRGYDSAGLAGVCDDRIICIKAVGNIAELEKKVTPFNHNFSATISHTRWATHGKPNTSNAHPHFNQGHDLAIVHNGIIENYLDIRNTHLKGEDVFYSDTDTEVVAKLISSFYEDDILAALKKTVKVLRGSYAIAIIHNAYPGQIFAICNKSPLCIGKTKDASFISSDANAFLEKDMKITYMEDNQICHIKKNEIIVYNDSLKALAFKLEKFKGLSSDHSKKNFKHFMLKEIFEQPVAIQKAIENRCLLEHGTAAFDLKIPDAILASTKHITIIGCGTAFHAALIGASYIEELARIPTNAEIASEFRYKNPIILENTLIVAVSQSGETADTIAAIKEAKNKGAKVLSICNREYSTLDRESDGTIFLNAGPEISVCSTKAFTSQVTILYLFSIYMARLRNMSKEEGRKYIEAIIQLPSHIDSILKNSKEIQKAAVKYSHFKSFIFIGRRYMFPSALEAALKLKEISYLNACAYPAGELKHGPIALLDPVLPVVGLCANLSTYEKICSNLMEAKARSAPLLAIALKKSEKIPQIADDIIYLPDCIDELSVLTTSVVCQLFAYYIANELGTEIDQPRNLAKSVTVE